MISDGKNAVVEKYRANNDPAIGIVSSDWEECVKKAADACPVQAISFEKVD